MSGSGGATFDHVGPGDPLSIPHADYNAAMDAARAHQRGGSGGPVVLPNQTAQNTIVWAKNDSGTPIKRFGVLSITEALITPDANILGFQNQHPLVGVTPTTDTERGRFAIAIEPIRPGKLGRCVIDGLIVATVDITDAHDRRADILADHTDRLQSHPAGAAEIITPAKGETGEQWCVIRIGPRPVDPFAKYLAKITGHTAVESGSANVGQAGTVTVDYRWEYLHTEVTLLADGTTEAVAEHARVGSNAINLAELAHTAGYSWAQDIQSADYPAGHRPRPIGGAGASNSHRTDDIVEMHEGKDANGARVYWFDRVGSHDGGCE